MGFRKPPPLKCADIIVFMSNTNGEPNESHHDFHFFHNPAKTKSFQAVFMYKNDEKIAQNHDHGKEQIDAKGTKKKAKKS